MKTEHDKDLSRMNTFGMKVRAAEFVEYDSMADFFEIDFESLPKPLLHIGGGSNLLFTGDFPGTVLHSAIKFIAPMIDSELQSDNTFEEEVLYEEDVFEDMTEDEEIEFVEESVSDDGDENDEYVRVSVGAGVSFDDFCAWAASHGLWGVENLSHIPGEVGAAAVQNIGAYGVEVKDVIETVYCFDIEEEEFVHLDVSECEYGYRDSIFKSPEAKGRYIVTHVLFRLSKKYSPQLGYGHLKDAVENAAENASEAITPQLIRQVVISIRQSKLPEVTELGSAGSFFKNPVVPEEVFMTVDNYAKAKYGDDYMTPHYDVGEGMVKIPAAWLIEQCGWKGYREGNVAVYEKQPLVIVNFTGKASPDEVVTLENKIVASVRSQFGIDLHPEVEHIF